MSEEHDPQDPRWTDVDVVVLGCWPKWAMAVEPYTGCTNDECSLCGMDVWVGPKQASVRAVHIEQGREVKVVCLPCTARLQAARAGMGHDDVHEILNLGSEATPAGRARMDQVDARLREIRQQREGATEHGRG